MKRTLPMVTLIGVDCVDIARLQAAADICEKELSFGSVKLLSSISSDDPRVIAISPIRSTKEYSEFCIKQMATYIDTRFAIVFQYDGFILNPAAWDDDFLNYDYIGAPWYHLRALRVGNGGFSLRSKRLLDFVATQYHTIGGTLDPEDVWLSETARPTLEKAGMTFAPEDVAARFSKEGNHHSVVWHGEFGFHGIKYTDISAWIATHTEYTTQLTYKLDDYATLMKTRHPIWDGTFHTLRYHRTHMRTYTALAHHERDYDVRVDDDLDEDVIEPGHTVICKRSGVSFDSVPIPAFERVVTSVEHFPTKGALLAKYPNIEITYPTKIRLPKWQQRLIRIFGNYACPRTTPYTLIRFGK